MRRGGRLRPSALAALAASCALAAGCVGSSARPLGPHREVDVAFARPEPAPLPDAPRPAAARAVLVIPPAFEQYVYVHYDPRWRRTFRIHLGPYLRDRLIEITARRFRGSRVVASLAEAPTLPDGDSFLLVPELGQIEYRTPWYDTHEDARFQLDLRLRVLYSTRREATTAYASGAASGPFGEHGVGTPDIVREALDALAASLERDLAESVRGL